ncbi:MAG: PDZ domain-containing protein [Gammaproteobacteria bacterium]|nr:PDZ domain-containing protein [Gammaproteobacteria bacterium]MDH3506322.1 PDZ domain-containing protein [Gammaproteobacteria bacterium]
MLKASLFIVLGVVVGAGLATLLDREPMPEFSEGTTSLVADSEPDNELTQRLAALESALAEEAERRASLEAQFVLVTERLDELVSTARAEALNVAQLGEDVVVNPVFEGVRVPRGTRFAEMREQRSPENRQNRLIEAGFSPEQAQSLIDREAQMRMDLMNASYEARRQGESFNPIDMQREAQVQLQTELGADAYERYLEATGQPTSVNVFEVIDNSAGQTAGLQTGDEIVGYNGERVFSLRDLQALTIAGEPGETVAVDILRDGQPMQIYMPRGPLGITGGGRGRAGGLFLP